MSYFEQEKHPFQGTINPEFLWLSNGLTQTLQDLQKGLTENSGFFILTGDLGTGKSTLKTKLASMFKGDFLVGEVADPGTDFLALVKLIAHSFNIHDSCENTEEFRTLFYQLLKTQKTAGKRVLLIIDEAQNLDTNKLEAVISLIHSNDPHANNLRILLVGRENLLDVLSEAKRESSFDINPRIYDIKPLTSAETADYIVKSLEFAGVDNVIINTAATLAVHQYSKGILRQINTICDNALLSAFLRNIDEITPEIIQQTAHKFGLNTNLEPSSTGQNRPSSSSRIQPQRIPRKVIGGIFFCCLLCGGFFIYSKVYKYNKIAVKSNSPEIIQESENIARDSEKKAKSSDLPATRNSGSKVEDLSVKNNTEKPSTPNDATKTTTEAPNNLIQNKSRKLKSPEETTIDFQGYPEGHIEGAETVDTALASQIIANELTDISPSEEVTDEHLPLPSSTGSTVAVQQNSTPRLIASDNGPDAITDTNESQKPPATGEISASVENLPSTAQVTVIAAPGGQSQGQREEKISEEQPFSLEQNDTTTAFPPASTDTTPIQRVQVSQVDASDTAPGKEQAKTQQEDIDPGAIIDWLLKTRNQ